MNFFKKRNLIFIIGAIVFFGAVFLFFEWKKNKQLETTVFLGARSVEPSLELFDGINGVKVREYISLFRPLAVIVENHPNSRPQSGLSKADIVYEALVEGGITRFLALYQSQDADSIGSVRSAREYFAQIADEWGAVFAYVGGSNEVIAQLKKGIYKNLTSVNEFSNTDFFPRRKDKAEPHHIFTSTGNLRELILTSDFSNLVKHQIWHFKDDAPSFASDFTKASSDREATEGRPTTASLVSNIHIDFSLPGHEVTWDYDSAQNNYKRLQYFKPHIDELTGEQILTKTIVVQIVKVTPVPKDPLLQVDIDLESGGKAIVFMDGGKIEGEWKKQDGRTRFYDALNNEIKFNRGNIWVELVPKDKESKLSYN